MRACETRFEVKGSYIQGNCMNKLKRVLTGAILALSFSIEASTIASGWVSVYDIYTPVSGQPFVTFASGAMPGCYGNNSAYLPVGSGTVAGKLVYSSLLAAQAAKKDVRVYYKKNDQAPGYAGWGLCSIVAISVR